MPTLPEIPEVKIIEGVKVSELLKQKADYNPRTMPRVDMDALKRSLKNFGVAQVVVRNKKTNTIVGGHQTIDAANELGIKTLNVAEVDLPLEKEKALNLALNKISGMWDTDKLEEVLRERDDESRLLTGFNESEISKTLGEMEEETEELTAKAKKKEPQMIITFPSAESLHDSRPAIEEIVQQVGGRYTRSSGEF